VQAGGEAHVPGEMHPISVSIEQLEEVALKPIIV
jgi:hypothetical protein